MYNKFTSILKIIFFLYAGIFLSVSGFGQQKARPKELKIGDTIPALTINNLINSSGKTVNVAQLYRHGLLIINFWATWCKPCVAELPLLDSLKVEFHDKLNVLSVAYEDSIVVKNFLKSHQQLRLPNLIMTCNDTLLAKYFRHRSLPHNVWIDRDGIVRAITSAEEINEENIKGFITRKETNLNVKQDKIGFDFTKPFHLGDSIFQYRSISTKYINGIPSGCAAWGTHAEGMQRIFIFNYKIIDMFSIAFYRDARVAENYSLTTIYTKDSIKFFRPEQIKVIKDRARYKMKIDWEKDNLYCYDLTLPSHISDTLFYQYMLEDLKRMFNVSCTTSSILTACNVVTSISGSKYSLTNYHSTHDSTKVDLLKDRLTLQHATVKDLVTKILGTFRDRDLPWIDESGINFPLDLTIHFEPGESITMAVIKAKLLEYGLKVEQHIRTYPVMVLKDLN